MCSFVFVLRAFLYGIVWFSRLLVWVGCLSWDFWVLCVVGWFGVFVVGLRDQVSRSF